MKKIDLHNVNWELIGDILTDKASNKQKSDFENWLETDVANESFFNDIKEIWVKTGNLSYGYSQETNEAWEIVKLKTTQKRNKVFYLKPAFYSVVSIAASLLILLFVGKAILYPDETIFSAKNNSIVAQELPDKSVIDLNYDTELKYKTNFIRKKREVWLSGEAFFDVEQMKTKPFIIHTEHGNFKVLGTSFNISSYKNDSLLSLSVKTGVVEFFPNSLHGSIKVKKGEQVHYNINNKKLKKHKSKTENYIAWKTKTLVFDDLRLEEITQILEKTYNTKIKFENNSLKELRFTAEFKNQSLDKILKVISLTFELEVEKIDNYIKLLEIKNEQTKDQNN
ncbi:MAG: hypothetical protein C0597_08455 [Marinilabiliales bacterium]|nr:MAG: hypothetical protein C0597_08455 [Marinilabiliales bacterium]